MPAPEVRGSRRDARDDLRVLLLTAGILLVVFSIGATLQTVFVYQADRFTGDLPQPPSMLWARLGANLLAVSAVLIVCWLVRINERRPAAIAAIVFAVAIGVGVGRHLLQLALGIYVDPSVETSAVEIVTVAVVIVLSLGIGLAQVHARVRLREQERAAAEQRLRASSALAQLATEEIRVRRDVADELHGRLQGRLVLIESRLTSLARQEGGAVASALDEVRTELAEVRELEVREMGQLLYPVGVDVDLEHALHALVRRVPGDIDITADVSTAANRAVDGTGTAAVALRIALVRAAEEGITNALRHGGASTVRIVASVEADEERPVVQLTVDNDGSGPPPSPRWGGIARLRERLSLGGGTAELSESELGGARLVVRIPTSR